MRKRGSAIQLLFCAAIVSLGEPAVAEDFPFASGNSYERVTLLGGGAGVAYIERKEDVAVLWVKLANGLGNEIAPWEADDLNFQVEPNGKAFLILRADSQRHWSLRYLNPSSRLAFPIRLPGQVSGFGSAGPHGFKVLTQDTSLRLTLITLDFLTGKVLRRERLGDAEDVAYSVSGDVDLIRTSDGKWTEVGSRRQSGVDFTADGLGGAARASKKIGLALFESADKTDFSNFVLVDIRSGTRTLLDSHPTSDVLQALQSPLDGHVDAFLRDGPVPKWIVLDADTSGSLAFLRASLAGLIKVLARSNDDTVWLVSASDTSANARFYVFDRSRRELAEILGPPPGSLPDEGSAEVSTIESVDGTPIEIWISPPRKPACDYTRKSCPFVVKLHGGPHRRDGHQYDAEVPWLQGQGYWVLRVNFRGSSGFGKEFANSSDHEWGGKVIDDIRQAVHHFVERPGVDKSRGAAIGSSFGGFAAIALSVFEPSAVRCVESHNGGGDLQAFAKLVPERQPSMKEDIAKEIGDINTDGGRELIMRQSPLTQLKPTDVRYLIEYGAKDLTTPPEQSSGFVEQLVRTSGNLIALRYESEGHQWQNHAQMLNHYRILGRFLSSCLKGGERWSAPIHLDGVTSVGSREQMIESGIE